MTASLTLYPLSRLATVTGVGVKTLRRWRNAGWLRPTAYVGEDARYSMRAFEVACEESVRGNSRPTPTTASAENEYSGPGWTKRISKKLGYG